MWASPRPATSFTAEPPLLIEPRELLALPLRGRAFSTPLAQLLSELLGIEAVNGLYAAVAHQPPGLSFYEAILREMNIRIDVDESDLRKIPRDGSLLAVANHPLGALEGIVLLLLLERVRPDVRMLANGLLSRIPQLGTTVIPVDPFGGSRAAQSNLPGMRAALSWLRQSHALGVFPAGEVSHWNARERRVVDPPWNPNIARLALRTGATVLPVYFSGANGFAFHLAGMLHPRLRTAQLARELLGKRDGEVRVRIGGPLSSSHLEACGSDEVCIGLLRNRTYLLGCRPGSQGRAQPTRWLPRPVGLPLAPRPVGPGASPSLVEREVDSLTGSAHLAEMGDFQVYLARAQDAPNVLREIGRLREITFRDAGEGSGKSLDLDRFDRHYQHLFVWNKARHEIVGAYRLALVHEVLTQQGPGGLYLHSLFHFRPGFFEQLGPAMELGRSFVRKEYQRSSAALPMLWKGIAAVVLRNPGCTRLLGPVSISNGYTPHSRQILVDFLTQRRLHPLSLYVRPRKPFQARRLLGWHSELAHLLLREVDELSGLIAEIEEDRKGIPVLLRQYLKLGGEILAFNVDPQFSNVLDGLILVDLLQADPKILARYMGKDQVAAFMKMAPPRGSALRMEWKPNA